MNYELLLQTVTLAVAGWTLKEVIAHGKELARLDQALKDVKSPYRAK